MHLQLVNFSYIGIRIDHPASLKNWHSPYIWTFAAFSCRSNLYTPWLASGSQQLHCPFTLLQLDTQNAKIHSKFWDNLLLHSTLSSRLYLCVPALCDWWWLALRFWQNAESLPPTNTAWAFGPSLWKFNFNLSGLSIIINKYQKGSKRKAKNSNSIHDNASPLTLTHKPPSPLSPHLPADMRKHKAYLL